MTYLWSIVIALVVWMWAMSALLRRVYRRIERMLSAYEYMTMCPVFVEHCNRLVDEEMKRY